MLRQWVQRGAFSLSYYNALIEADTFKWGGSGLLLDRPERPLVRFVCFPDMITALFLLCVGGFTHLHGKKCVTLETRLQIRFFIFVTRGGGGKGVDCYSQKNDYAAFVGCTVGHAHSRYFTRVWGGTSYIYHRVFFVARYKKRFLLKQEKMFDVKVF
eukprot:GEMP01106104.1.p1 GENE.GEMP01106104.1~~GEMP01106104.1.p1  ORF type:complete len:157 (-),score=6.60 GEMP01106104.1:236-706(-)